MGDKSVTIFHFTDKISQAKLSKYYKSTSRGMAPPGSSQSSHARSAKRSHDVPESTASTEPPAKKQRLRINVGPRRESDEGGDTIAVAPPKPPQDKTVKIKYGGDMVMTPTDQTASAKVESSRAAASPAPSSASSALSSAPPSAPPSPFVDPPEPTGREGYGDFMTYYIDGSDEDADPIAKPKAVTKPAAKAAPKRRKSTPKPKVSKAPTPATLPPSAPLPSQQLQSDNAHLLQGHAPQQERAQPPQQYPAPPPQQQQQLQHPQFPQTHTQRSHHAIQAPHPGAPQNRPQVQGPPRPSVNPQPIVQFSEIVHDPPPTTPDTVAIMIKKLRTLSLALTTFGGVPPAPPLSPSPPPTPVKTTPDSGDNPLDNFLSFFDGDGDDEINELDRELKDSGTLDGPLTHGIIFIQNALKSWAQQRVSQMYTLQYHQQLQAQQQTNSRRGPGRPRKFDEPGGHLLPPSPVIQMELAATPEGMAIKAFQAVLHSACLRVNVRLPASLACALRQLYMQIDLLINQGEREPQADWQCMSYGAQISAHKTRVDRWKEHQAKLHEETQRAHSLAHQNMMAQMGLPQQQHYPMTAAQAEHDHAVQLETRRAQAHAHQQPYIRQQHLNPLQLGIHPSGPPPASFVPSQPANAHMRPASAGPHNGRSESMGQMVAYNTTPATRVVSSSPGVQLDKMKLYVPGYLPRSGQNMKFSFGPQPAVHTQPSGMSAYPSTESPGSGMANKVPMSAPPIQASLQPAVDLTNGSTAGSRPSTNPVGTETMGMAATSQARRSIVQSLTPAETPAHTSSGNFRAHQSPQTPAIVTHGFTPVNAPAPRTSSAPVHSPTDTSPNTIKVASKKSSSSAAVSASPRSSNKRSASEMSGHVENKTMPSKFPHPGAIVLDQ